MIGLQSNVREHKVFAVRPLIFWHAESAHSPCRPCIRERAAAGIPHPALDSHGVADPRVDPHHEESSPPPEIDSDPRAPERLEDKLAQVEEAVSFGEAHALQLDEAEVNVLMRSALGLGSEAADLHAPAGRGSRLPAVTAVNQESTLSLEGVQSSIRDFRIGLSGDQVHAHVVYNLYGKNITLLLEGRLFSRAGSVRFEPTGARLGSLRIPRVVLERAVGRHFDAPENLDKLRLPPQVEDLRVENGELIISYR